MNRQDQHIDPIGQGAGSEQHGQTWDALFAQAAHSEMHQADQDEAPLDPWLQLEARLNAQAKDGKQIVLVPETSNIKTGGFKWWHIAAALLMTCLGGLFLILQNRTSDNRVVLAIKSSQKGVSEVTEKSLKDEGPDSKPALSNLNQRTDTNLDADVKPYKSRVDQAYLPQSQVIQNTNVVSADPPNDYRQQTYQVQPDVVVKPTADNQDPVAAVRTSRVPEVQQLNLKPAEVEVEIEIRKASPKDRLMAAVESSQPELKQPEPIPNIKTPQKTETSWFTRINNRRKGRTTEADSTDPPKLLRYIVRD